MNLADRTRDRFLGGRIIADQPVDGFRAGHDTVLLAAAVPAKPGDRALELGSGVGVASLCLAARVSGLATLGIDMDVQLVGVANENAALNGMADRVRFVTADVQTFSHVELFDHVFFNPPFHPHTGQVSPKVARDRAKRDTANAIASWTKSALALVKPKGIVSAILRPDRVREMLTEVMGRTATLMPLYPRAGGAPKRMIVRIANGESGPLRYAEGLILHEPDGGNTPAAQAVLRHGAALDFA